jgi:uncharacterized protein
MYKQTAQQFTRMLENLSHWLDKAQMHADAKKFDVNVLTTARLAPDQYAFTRQVQSACDAAKFCCARITGKEAPKHEDNEQTFEQLRQRIHKCLTYLKTFTPADFKDCEKRPVTLPYLEGKTFLAEDYAITMATPNFYFHVTTAYAILRHNGVNVGKTDYIGELKTNNL